MITKLNSLLSAHKVTSSKNHIFTGTEKNKLISSLCKIRKKEVNPSKDITYVVKFGEFLLGKVNQKFAVKIQPYFNVHQSPEISKIFKRVAGVIICYDVCSERSFQQIQNFLNILPRNINKKIQKPIILVGNKHNVQNKTRKLSYEYAQNFALKNNLFFKEVNTSSKSNSDIREVYLYISKIILEKIKKRVINCKDPSCGVKRGIIVSPSLKITSFTEIEQLENQFKYDINKYNGGKHDYQNLKKLKEKILKNYKKLDVDPKTSRSFVLLDLRYERRIKYTKKGKYLFKGTWKDDKFNEFGKIFSQTKFLMWSKDHIVFEGNYKNGKRHGYGKVYYDNDKILPTPFKGIFSNDKLVYKSIENIKEFYSIVVQNSALNIPKKIQNEILNSFRNNSFVFDFVCYKLIPGSLGGDDKNENPLLKLQFRQLKDLHNEELNVFHSDYVINLLKKMIIKVNDNENNKNLSLLDSILARILKCCLFLNNIFKIEWLKRIENQFYILANAKNHKKLIEDFLKSEVSQDYVQIENFLIQVFKMKREKITDSVKDILSYKKYWIDFLVKYYDDIIGKHLKKGFYSSLLNYLDVRVINVDMFSKGIETYFKNIPKYLEQICRLLWTNFKELEIDENLVRSLEFKLVYSL